MQRDLDIEQTTKRSPAQINSNVLKSNAEMNRKTWMVRYLWASQSEMSTVFKAAIL